MRPNPPRGGGGAVWRQPFFWLLGLALLLRLAWVAAKPDFTFADERWYLEIAQSLHAGEGYESPSLRFAVRQAPGQPFFLAAWGGVFPLTPVSAKVANSLVGWLALVLMAWALRRHTGSDSLTTAFCLLAGFHPSLLYTCATNYPQSLQLLSVALVCVLLLRLRGAPTAAATGRLALAAGLAVGAGALCVTTQLFMAPSIPLAAWVGRKNWLLAGVLAVAGVGLAVAPWAVRNAVVEKAFIPLSASGGEMLHLGNNPNTVPNTTSTAAAKDKDPQMKADLLASRSAAEADRVYQAHAKAWMKANPRQALRLWALKTANFFRWDAGKLATEQRRGVPAEAWIARLTTLGVYGLFAWGIGAALRQRQWYWPAVSVSWLVLTAAAMGLFVTRYRYRLPLEPALLWVGLLGAFEAGHWRFRGMKKPPLQAGCPGFGGG
jgi:hypothetical protein